LLDEPTSALDDISAQSLITNLKSFASEHHIGLLIATHSNLFDDIATKVLNIQGGTLVEK
jgi:ABC-type lipoprotein export system ATPase subunit